MGKSCSIIHILLLVTNSLCVLIGAGFSLVSGLFCWSTDVVYLLIKTNFKDLEGHLSVHKDHFGSEAALILQTLTYYFSVPIFIMATILLFIGLIGILMVYHNKLFITLFYIILVFMYGCAHIGLISFHFGRVDLHNNFMNAFLKHLVLNYKSLQSMTPESLLMGAIMMRLKCCGFLNGTDFRHSEAFNASDFYDKHEYTGLEYPTLCCAMRHNVKVTSQECPSKFSPDNSYIHIGCRQLFNEEVLSYMELIALLSFGIMFMNICSLYLAIRLLFTMKEEIELEFDYYYPNPNRKSTKSIDIGITVSSPEPDRKNPFMY